MSQSPCRFNLKPDEIYRHKRMVSDVFCLKSQKDGLVKGSAMIFGRHLQLSYIAVCHELENSRV